MAPGLIVSAPASGAGKTMVTLGLLAAFRARGLAVQPFKTGRIISTRRFMPLPPGGLRSTSTAGR
jgi:BioD-like phosphotransacetylase family protein